MLWRTEFPIKCKCEKNKKGDQRNPPQLDNISRPVIPQLNTVWCPKISNPSKECSPCDEKYWHGSLLEYSKKNYEKSYEKKSYETSKSVEF